MKHLKNGSPRRALCGARGRRGEPLTFVTAALESDCDQCRSEVMVGPPAQTGCQVREVLDYTPEPYQDLEPLSEIRKKRDGRK